MESSSRKPPNKRGVSWNMIKVRTTYFLFLHQKQIELYKADVFTVVSSILTPVLIQGRLERTEINQGHSIAPKTTSANAARANP